MNSIGWLPSPIIIHPRCSHRCLDSELTLLSETVKGASLKTVMVLYAEQTYSPQKLAVGHCLGCKYVSSVSLWGTFEDS